MVNLWLLLTACQIVAETRVRREFFLRLFARGALRAGHAGFDGAVRGCNMGDLESGMTRFQEHTPNSQSGNDAGAGRLAYTG
jgi:hypothetical protein